jgi:peptidoglycan/LPS O-acetylase OafA/YrhL
MSSLAYRPEVDGLRALAVLSVLFFHAGLGFPGGFVGVDVFFVLSGYLITSILVKELETGTFRFAAFWGRRARRILPASIAVTIFTLVAGLIILLPADLRRLGISATSQALFSANIYFWYSVDYFAGPAEEIPLLHTWSLAVEEQYYFIFPFILAGCFAIPSFRSRRRLLYIMAAMFGLSLGISIVAVKYIPEAAFYLLPARAWEMLAGSLLAILPNTIAPKSKANREIISYLGLGLILVPVFYYSKQTAFPGLAALPPVLGTALIIWSNGSSTLPSHSKPGLTSVGHVLASRPMVFIGLISYSLYLWHWPLFAFTKYWTLNNLTTGHSLLLVAASFLLAIASWRYIETPFRLKKILAPERSILWAGGCATLVVFCAGAALWTTQGLPSRFSTQVVEFAKVDKIERKNVTVDDIRNGKLIKFGSEIRNGNLKLLLWGDSHARTFIPAFDKVARDHQLAGYAITYSATLPLLQYDGQLEYGLGKKSREWSLEALRYIQKNQITDVFLGGYWTNPALNADPRIAESLQNTIKAIRASGARVWVLLSIPNHDIEVPRALAFMELGRLDNASWQRRPTEHYTQQTPVVQVQNLNQDNDVRFIDFAPIFETQDKYGNTIYKIVENGRKIYYDKHHLTADYVSTNLYTELSLQFRQNYNQDKK